MNLEPFCILADWAVRVVLKISAIEGVFFSFLGTANTYVIRVSVCRRVCTKKLINRQIWPLILHF